MTAAKTKPAKCQVQAILQVLMAIRHSVEAIHWKISTLNEPVLWTKS